MQLGHAWLVALVASGCVVGEELIQPPPVDPVPDPVDPVGLVHEPANGSVLPGDPSTLAIRVAGEYDEVGAALSVQILSNPDDLTSWQTLATATTTAQADATKASFSVDVRPVTSTADQARWPRGGVLRLRVVDDAGRALPYDTAQPDASVLVVVNPAAPPASWQYLVEKNPGSIEETIAYYAAIDAPPTLDEFMTRFGFPGDETTAIYYNAGDLGIGRDMHCRATTTPAGGVACYSRNFGTFGGSLDDALAQAVAQQTPLATVTMVYTPPIDAPNAVQFMVYGANGALVNEAQLDTHGNNTSIPQNCLNCHGGRARYDEANNAVLGARFLPLDPAAFVFAQRADLTFVAQEDKFRRLNRLVAAAAPSTGVRDLIDGMFPANNAPYAPTFVPTGWSATEADRVVYREVIAPYCRGCHASFESAGGDALVFDTAASLRAKSAATVARLCGTGPLGMPAAEVTTIKFFDSSARGLLLQWLGAPGACAPAQP